MQFIIVFFILFFIVNKRALDFSVMKGLLSWCQLTVEFIKILFRQNLSKISILLKGCFTQYNAPGKIPNKVWQTPLAHIFLYGVFKEDRPETIEPNRQNLHDIIGVNE